MRIIPKIISYQTQQNNKIKYNIEIKDSQSQNTKISKLRFSELKDIHQQLQKIVSKHKLHLSLPHFPKRKIIGSTNKSEELIRERQNQLNLYLGELLSIQKLHSLQIVKKYFIPEQFVQVIQNKNQFPLKICIDRYTLVEDVVIYHIKIHNIDNNESWTFKTRYKQLKSMHEALIQHKIKNLPEFPKKKIFGITNQNPQDIERRRQELQKYFNEIFCNKQVMKSEALKYFVEQSKKQAERDKQLQQLKRKSRQI